MSRFGYNLVFACGIALIALATYLALTGKDSTAFVVAGAVLVAFGSTAGLIASIKMPGNFELVFKEQALANALESVKLAMTANAVDSSESSESAEVATEEAVAALSTAAAAFRGEALVPSAPLTIPTPVRSRLREAEEWVMRLEQQAGRNPTPVERGEPGDLASPPRRIEIKMMPRSVPWITLTHQEFEASRSDPNFWIYLAEPQDPPSADRDPFLIRAIGGKALQDLLATARERREYLLPVRSLQVQGAPGVLPDGE